MVVPQRAVQLGGPEGFRDESDRGTVLQRFTSGCVNIRTDNDRTDTEAFVNLACSLGVRETEVHENDVRSVHFCAGDGSILCGRHRTDLMAKICYELLKAHRDDHLISSSTIRSFISHHWSSTDDRTSLERDHGARTAQVAASRVLGQNTKCAVGDTPGLGFI
jgi:hypothetical protein